jgi:serine/threonine protein kinase
VDQPNLSGELLAGKYRVGDVIGTGGMGIVYAATHTELRVPCAVKVIARARHDSNHAKRLIREARMLATLSGPYSVRVLDAGRMLDGSPYLVMERLMGEPLSELLRRNGALPLGRALTFARQICAAVREVHARGIIHRDLKPSNVFVLDEERIKVLDFGLAMRFDGSGHDSTATASEFAGSPSYMSPEQIRASADVTPASDIWSLGVLTFEMLTGQLPFDGANKGAILAAIVADPPTRLAEVLPSAPPELDRLLADCLEKNPRDRPASVAEIQARLEAIAANERDSAAIAPSSPARAVERDDPESTLVQPVRRIGENAAFRPARWTAVLAACSAVAIILLLLLGRRGVNAAQVESARTPVESGRAPQAVTARAAPSVTIATSSTTQARTDTAPPPSSAAATAPKTTPPRAGKVVAGRSASRRDVAEAISTRH